MAIFHLSVKTVARSAGRSATAAAAYRACEVIECERQGITHDYTKKRGLIHAEIIAPDGAPAWAHNRAALWNATEAAETRKNSTVAREFEIALPAELNAAQRKALAQAFTRELVERHGFAADLCIHDDHDRNQNHHAHILCTTRVLSADGFTAKTRELDEKTSGAVDRWRERWAELVNEALERQGHTDRVSALTLAAQGVERPPTQHLGAAATGFERRTGQPSDNRQRQEQAAAEKARQDAEHQRKNPMGTAAELRYSVQLKRLTAELNAEIEAEKQASYAESAKYFNGEERATGDKTDAEASKRRLADSGTSRADNPTENVENRLAALIQAYEAGTFKPEETYKPVFVKLSELDDEGLLNVLNDAEGRKFIESIITACEPEMKWQNRVNQAQRSRGDSDMSL